MAAPPGSLIHGHTPVPVPYLPKASSPPDQAAGCAKVPLMAVPSPGANAPTPQWTAVRTSPAAGATPSPNAPPQIRAGGPPKQGNP